jgi:hypothetical protein
VDLRLGLDGALGRGAGWNHAGNYAAKFAGPTESHYSIAAKSAVS